MLFPRRLLSRRRGFSTLLLVGGLMACSTLFVMVAFVAPASWVRSREVARLTRPAPAEVRALEPGSALLLAARLPEGAGAGPYDLALYFVEVEQEAEEGGGWLTTSPPAEQVALLLEDGSRVAVRLPPNIPFFNAHVFEETEDLHRRYVGFYPAQLLTVEGTWEGGEVVTARALYRGSPDAYVTYWQGRPLKSVTGGVICGGIGGVLLLLALLAWLVGR
ncbi:MAG: hypothetical protein ACLFU8_11235 [Anaerolineales bacterium]